MNIYLTRQDINIILSALNPLSSLADFTEEELLQTSERIKVELIPKKAVYALDFKTTDIFYPGFWNNESFVDYVLSHSDKSIIIFADQISTPPSFLYMDLIDALRQAIKHSSIKLTAGKNQRATLQYHQYVKQDILVVDRKSEWAGHLFLDAALFIYN